MENLDDICLAEPAFWKRPDKLDVFKRFRSERPVAWQTMLDSDRGYWSLTRHADTRAITKNPKLFTSYYGTGMATDDPEMAYVIGGMLNRDAPPPSIPDCGASSPRFSRPACCRTSRPTSRLRRAA